MVNVAHESRNTLPQNDRKVIPLWPRATASPRRREKKIVILRFRGDDPTSPAGMQVAA